MKIFLSSIAKNDIRLLIRVFNAEEQEKGKYFLDDLKKTISYICNHPEESDSKYKEILVYKMKKFPVHIHCIVENQEDLFITAIFKEN